MNDEWPDPIKEVLNLSFSPHVKQRPSIQLFYNMLRFQLLNLRDGDASKLEHSHIKRRRSFSSMKDIFDGMDGEDKKQFEDQKSDEKFPQRVRNTIMNHVKPPPQSANSDGHQQVAPRRRTRNKLRDKFRLSVKHEE